MAVNQAYVFRNKIIHGQQTGINLTGACWLPARVTLREWCETVAKEGMERFGYDGFGRASLRKTNRADITASVDKAIKDDGWEVFVKSL
ncbi:hypothetical protein [Mesorhizobium sp. CAU 1732]|uniref:hypothetical protein n=1 Tax=Mesorhizobium sp. CAU 1732 TaxID=3140358 RepID=UPI003260B203